MVSLASLRYANWLLLAVLVPLMPTARSQANTGASLLLAAESARPGDTVLAAVRLQMPKRWHTYWRNPGESGKATEVNWRLPEGVRASALQWPVPEAHTASDMTTFIHQGEVLLLAILQLDSGLSPGPLELKARVDWLECDVACVPGDAEVTARLTIGSERKPSAQAALLATWEKRIPRPDPGLQIRGSWESPPTGERATLIISGRKPSSFEPKDFYAYGGSDYEVAPAVMSLPAAAGEFRLQKSVKKFGKSFPAALPGIVVGAGREPGPAPAVEVTLAPGGPAGQTVAALAPAPAAGKVQTSLLAMLGLAFLGGLILNVMPCVLPVIALKVLGFVHQSQEAPARVRQLGLVYALGVLASFLVLAGVVIQVQQAGGGASWGMQMQNPQFRLVLLLVVVLVALNLFGVFEVLLPGQALGAAAGLAAREGAAGAFFNGVLATALATPCTAPFLAVALGFAFTQPAWVILLTFTAVALGLATPYVLLSWQPGWLRFLPKPGPWMLRFKVAMGFPMLATAVWLFDFTAPAFGDGGWLWLGLFLVILALTAWIWGEFVQRGRARRGLAMGACAAFLMLNYAYVLEGQLRWRSPVAKATGSAVVRDTPEGIAWHTWTPEAVEAARRAGHPVLVDFTAKWCFTCKSNKKTAIDIPEVRARMQALNVQAFRADNTDPTPLITAELQRHGRAGVPLVLVFPADLSQPPEVLPELLPPGGSAVLAALNRAAGAP
jgi:thiol:disulfide interchange protein DsbD